MKVLVTGSEGYVGQYTVEELKAKGHEVIGVDLTDTAHIKYNVCNSDFILMAKTLNVDAVIHLASYIAVGESVENPIKYLHNNIASLLNILAIRPKYIVFASSAAVYGDNTSSILSEMPSKLKDISSNTTSPYGFSKKVCEDILRESKIPHINLRYFNVCGEHDPTESHLIPSILKAIRTNKPFKCNGDGNILRDYVYVKDVARANAMALDYLERTDISLTLNVSSGIGTSINSIIEKMKTFYPSLEVVYGPNRAGDPESLVGSNELAEYYLGWKPTKNIQQIIETTTCASETH